MPVDESLDTIYVCKKCNASFIFRDDISDHHQTTGHTGMLEFLIDKTSPT